MTDTPALRSLLDGDYTAVGVAALLDEAISAELDDALDAVADDWDVGPFALRSAVSGAPDYDERRKSLARARSTLGASPVSPIDDVTRRRLVSTALDATESESGSTVATARRSRSTSRVARLSAAAAVVLLLGVAGAVVLAQRSNDSDGDAVATGSTDMSGEPELSKPSGDLPYLGGLDDVAAVVSAGVGVTLTPIQEDSAQSPSVEAPTAELAESDPAGDGASRSMTMTPAECASQIEDALPPGGEIVLRATGTLGGAPAAVVATRNGGLLTVATAPLDLCDFPTLESFTVAD